MPLSEQINAFTLQVWESFKSLSTEGRTMGSQTSKKNKSQVFQGVKLQFSFNIHLFFFWIEFTS